MSAVLAIWNDCRAGREAAYDSWYTEEHLPERLGVPGFWVGRRYLALEAGRQYLTTYEVEGVDVLTSQEYLARLENPTPRTQAVMQDGFENMSRTVCERRGILGAIRGSVVVTATLSGTMGMAQLEEMLQPNAERPGLLHREIWASKEQMDRIPSAEETMRGRDSKISCGMLWEFQDEAEAFGTAAAVRDTCAAAEIGVFRLLCSLSREDLT